MTQLLLCPQPRQVTYSEGAFALEPDRLILLDVPNPQALRFAAGRVRQALLDSLGVVWEMTASRTTPAALVALVLRLTPEKIAHPQGYELSIAPESIQINAHDEAGAFYGVCTLVQLMLQSPNLPMIALPCLRIVDWPDFPARGVMLDISRDKVPTLQTVFDLVDRLATWKVNQLQLYTEHTFAYRSHPKPWAKASPFTGEEILALDAFCRERHVQLVPNQNSFGHMQRWLCLPEYHPLAEAPQGYEYPWGGRSDQPFTLCPSDPGSIQLIRELYDELLPHFSSRMFNVGCDETWDLGQGRSQAECAQRGAGRVYLDFLLKIYHEVAARGLRMQFWGDIILQHPELVKDLPKDVIALSWGYEADHPFDQQGARFAEAGLEFYVCPGTSSWNAIAGRTDNALGNLRSAAENGLKHGAAGYLNTDWGDNGHWQPLPVSYLGFLAGAAYSWALEANRSLDVVVALNRHAFDDPAGVLGQVAYDLGNVYRFAGFEPENNSALHSFLQTPLRKIAELYGEKTDADTLRQALQAIHDAVARLPRAASTRQDASLLAREFDYAARTLRHACLRALLALGTPDKDATTLQFDLREIISEHRKVWRARNRPGGLVDSVARFEAARKDYLT
ncbi:MAG: glycoside hydrolase family 20 zincin-like fold domain-containing protein [Chloroflexota bacterium]